MIADRHIDTVFTVSKEVNESQKTRVNNPNINRRHDKGNIYNNISLIGATM